MTRHTVHAKDLVHDRLMKHARTLFPVLEAHHNGPHGYDAIFANGRDVWIVEFKNPGQEGDLSANEMKSRDRWGPRYQVVSCEAHVESLARGVPVTAFARR